MIKKDCPWIPPFAGPRKVLIKVSVASFVLVLLSCPEKEEHSKVPSFIDFVFEAVEDSWRLKIVL